MYRNKAVSIFFAILAILFVALTLVWAILVDLAMGLFVGVLVTLLLGIAGWFVLTLILYVRAKKRGEKCIGCPYCKQCGGDCSAKTDHRSIE